MAAIEAARCLEQLKFASSRSVLSISTESASPTLDSLPTTPRSERSAPSLRSGYHWCDVADTPPASPRSEKSSSPSLPERYPAALMIRNTFLDIEEGAASTSPVVRPRRTRSLEPARCSERTAATSISNVGVGAVGCKVAFQADAATDVELPSAGSRDHGTGNCKPCGFFWKSNGCSNGKNCVFCHLCGPKEKRQRHKEKKQLLKAQAAVQAASDKSAFVIPSR
eukprot:TRINITY_DN16954_c0_g1_i1.p1 TRINITY_DN16954_c0_g1~~TRINITY_DN16954_c0_g1_i1.p1  ORF type:complete len:224 (-),score=52.48 TRINITY_DN16954_c0_g1_i1:935-1606(-)